MQFNVLTIFPEVFEPYLDVSVIGRGKEDGLLDVDIYNIRDHATDKHNTVDGTPYGGGPGMVLKVGPIDETLSAIKQKGRKGRTIVLSAKGEQFTQRKAEEYAKIDDLTLICGRYEGIDQRVMDNLADEELSIGPYVLAGGELGALVVIEAVSRLIPGVLGNQDSLAEETFTSKTDERLSNQVLYKEYPQYTKPEEYKGWKVPEVLLSGNHDKIRKWREEQSKK
jgi:tRNA (guanine37-N1)-methyltransferase